MQQRTQYNIVQHRVQIKNTVKSFKANSIYVIIVNIWLIQSYYIFNKKFGLLSSLTLIHNSIKFKTSFGPKGSGDLMYPKTSKEHKNLIVMMGSCNVAFYLNISIAM